MTLRRRNRTIAGRTARAEGRLRTHAPSLLRSVLVWGLVVTLVGLSAAAPLPAAAQDAGEPEPSAAYEGVVGVGSVLSTLVYTPVKLVYALTGSLVSGLAWLVTWNTDVAAAIVKPAIGGDYVVTPANLEGREPLRFVGDT